VSCTEKKYLKYTIDIFLEYQVVYNKGLIGGKGQKVLIDFVASAGMPQAAGEPENRRTTASVWHFWPLLGRLVRLRPSVCRHMLFVHSIAFGHVMQIISIGHNMCRKII